MAKQEATARNLRDTLIEHGQYRDVSYIEKNGTSVERRCLIVPAKVIEPLTTTGEEEIGLPRSNSANLSPLPAFRA